MSDSEVIPIGFVRHLVKCPHCEQEVVHNWPGTMILYSATKCKHCGKEFVITLNEPRS